MNRILFVDDDNLFGKLLTYVGEKKGFNIDYYESLDEMGSFANLANYQLVIIDYFLDAMSGLEIAEYVDVFFPHIPVVLVTASHHLVDKETKWPKCIQAVVSKSEGVGKILQIAQSSLEKKSEVKSKKTGESGANLAC